VVIVFSSAAIRVSSAAMREVLVTANTVNMMPLKTIGTPIAKYSWTLSISPTSIPYAKPPRVSFQLRKSQILGLLACAVRSALRGLEDRNQPVPIVFRDGDNTHVLHAHAVLPMERRSRSRRRIQPSDFAGRNHRQEVDVRGRSR